MNSSSLGHLFSLSHSRSTIENRKPNQDHASRRTREGKGHGGPGKARRGGREEGPPTTRQIMGGAAGGRRVPLRREGRARNPLIPLDLEGVMRELM